VRIALCLLLLACGGKKESHGNVDKLKVTLDGKPVAVDRAYMTTPSRDLYVFTIGTKATSCTSQAGAVFSFLVAKRVSPKGEERWDVMGVSGRDVPLAIADIPNGVTLAGTHVGNLNLVEGAKFSATGDFDAVACPVEEPSGVGVPKAAHPSNAKIVIAGHTLPIKSATVQARPGVAATDMPNIWLSTSLRDCSKVPLPSQVQLERIDGKWKLHGTWLEKAVENVDAPELTFSANMVGKSADGPTLDLQLAGSAKLGDYAVELTGVVQAIECTN
jgi:hypothetical protein